MDVIRAFRETDEANCWECDFLKMNGVVLQTIYIHVYPFGGDKPPYNPKQEHGWQISLAKTPPLNAFSGGKCPDRETAFLQAGFAVAGVMKMVQSLIDRQSF